MKSTTMLPWCEVIPLLLLQVMVGGSRAAFVPYNNSRRSTESSSHLDYRHRNDDHDDDDKSTSRSSISTTSTSIQQLDIPDTFLPEVFDIPPIQQWLYHNLQTVQTSDMCWLNTVGDILTLSPLSITRELLTSLLYPSSSFSTSTSLSTPLATRMRFRFEVQRCLLRSLLMEPIPKTTDLTDVVQHGQSNTHPLGYSIMAIPPHTRLPLTILPSYQCATLLTGTLCIQQVVTSTWDPDTLCRQPYHCIGTPLSDLSFPPTKDDLILVAQDIQHRVDQELMVLQQEEDEEGRKVTLRMRMHPRQYATQGSFVSWNTGTILSLSTHEQPALLLCLSSNVPTLHYKPVSSSTSSSLHPMPTAPAPIDVSASLHARLFPKHTHK